eukprot:TRINITY_DN8633_c0_g1_i3.p1 TRINITY_DN8633_c0_g1~~TRINITY_DN8633_c0_g1_i3.p1  ORF type:complete len:147 (+),score=19.89 TRINITY_DN8633_c0_g1_i3:213-653(+)
MRKEDMFVMDGSGELLQTPDVPQLTMSACTPLFAHIYRERGAGAVIHSHSLNAMLATTLSDATEFRITHFEMIKGVRGHEYHDTLIVPIIENTSHECELADSLLRVIQEYPRSFAVLVRRHGVYVWGKSWVEVTKKMQIDAIRFLF